MSFWTTTKSWEPKRNFRFQVSISGFARDSNSDTVVWWAKKVTKPNFTIAEGKHVFAGHTFYFPGKVEWQEISMTLVDPVSPNAATLLMGIVEDSGYVLPKAAGSNKSLSKGKFSTLPTSTTGGGLGVIKITQLDSDGKVVEEWKLHGAFIKSLKLGDLDYENDDLSNIELGLRYDWAELDSKYWTLTGETADATTDSQ